MRLIDADALQKEYQKERGKRLLLIDVAPTIDAVEVVHCKDCKFSDSCEQVVDMYDGMEFHSNPIYHCSYGERRKE